MPELPEVEITKRGVTRLFLGETLKKMTVRQPKLRWDVPDEATHCVGSALKNVSRRSKYLLFDFGGQHQLIHLGMSGALRMVKAGDPWRKHDHIEWLFESGAMRFHDPRRFGSVGWCQSTALATHPRLACLGVEPFSEDFSVLHLYRQSRLRRMPVKSFLMAGKAVVGVGNIYASEALFLSGIRPGKAAGRLTRAEVAKLHAAVLQVLLDAIEQGGSSLRDFHSIEGELGYFQQKCRVYGREGQPCRVCQTPVKNRVIAQRASFLLPELSTMSNSQFAQHLLTWQRQHGRHTLPWQNTNDAYRVWLSEVMLQQTQVVTVMGYYQRFLAAFPTVYDLAMASQQQVLALWQGLGYYSRARNLHACAQKVVAEHEGIFPSRVAQLERLPGIGRSTAGAIASLAYGVRAPILDGNVKRVFCRYAGIEGYPEQAQIKKKLWALADDLLPQAEPGRYNQALMDLGSSVCLPKKPLCLQCPLKNECVGFETGLWQQLPTPKPKKANPVLHFWVLMVFDERGHLLMRQQDDSNLWKGLWMPPVIQVQPEVTLVDVLQTDPVFSDKLTTDMPVILLLEQQDWLKHELTHRRLRFKCFPMSLNQGDALPQGYSFGKVGVKPVPKVVLKLVERVGALAVL